MRDAPQQRPSALSPSARSIDDLDFDDLELDESGVRIAPASRPTPPRPPPPPRPARSSQPSPAPDAGLRAASLAAGPGKADASRSAPRARPESRSAVTAASEIIEEDLTPLFDRAAIAAGPRSGVARAVRVNPLGESSNVEAPAGTGPRPAIRDTRQPTLARSSASALSPPDGGSAPAGLAASSVATSVLPPAESGVTAAFAPAPAASDATAILSSSSTFNDSSSTSTGHFGRVEATDDSADSGGGPAGADHALDDEPDDRDDATTASPPATASAPGGTLRAPAALRRKRGLAGDVRYVATAYAGLRRARRELARLDVQQTTRHQARRHHLVTLGRVALTLDDLPHPALAAARAQLATLDDQRAAHADQIAAAEAALTRLRADREARAQQHVADLAARDAELVALSNQLAPLIQQAAGIRRRAGDLAEALREIDARIARTTASLAKDSAPNRAAIQAELATLKADRRAIQADEPALAGELDALNPRMAALDDARREAGHQRDELLRAEQDDQGRVHERLAAHGANRKVLDRAVAEAEAQRDRRLFELGEQLCVDRPATLASELAPIDELDVELGVADRRIMELREIVASVDRWKIARGVALLVVVLGALAAVTAWATYLAP